MDTILSLCFFIGFAVAVYFLIKWIIAKIKHTGGKHDFRNMLISIGVMAIALTSSILIFPPKKTTSATNHEADKISKSVATSNRKAKTKASQKNESSASSAKPRKSAVSKANSAASKVSSSSVQKRKTHAKPKSKPIKKTYDFSKVRLGMTMDQVINILGKPTEKSPLSLYYGDDDLDFDNGGKLSDGSPSRIHKAAMKQQKAESTASSEKKNNAEMLKSFAKTFGQKDVETLQKYVGSAYSSTETAQGMAYGWKTNYGMLYRIDVTSTGITHVYKDGLGPDNGGTQLYVGQTIKQKAKNYYFNNY